jgi:hypothetical protein
LRKEAASLNALLETERDQFRTLERSYAKSETALLAQTREALAERDKALADKNREALKARAAENQRNILAAALICAGVIITGVTVVRRRPNPP